MSNAICVVKIKIINGEIKTSHHGMTLQSMKGFFEAYQRTYGVTYTEKFKVSGRGFKHVYLMAGDQINGEGFGFYR